MISSSEAIKQRKEQDFIADLQMAQRVEKALAIWMDKQNAYKSVKIVNEKGFDILVNKRDGSIRKMEVKRDFWVDSFDDGSTKRRATDNICVELWSNFNCGNPGWIHYSDSNYIFYIGNENIYVLDTQKLKHITNNIVNMGEANRKEPTVKNTVNQNVAKINYGAHFNGNFKVRNVLIKKDYLLRHNCIIKILNRQESFFNRIAKEFKI